MVTTHQGMTKQSGSVFCYGNNSNLAEHLQCLETRLPCPMVMQTVRFSVSRSPYKNMPWLLLEEISVPLWQVQGRVKRSKILDKKKDEEKRGWHPSFFLLSFFFFIIADLTVQNSKILARCGLSDNVAGIWSGNAIVSRFFFSKSDSKVMALYSYTSVSSRNNCVYIGQNVLSTSYTSFTREQRGTRGGAETQLPPGVLTRCLFPDSHHLWRTSGRCSAHFVGLFHRSVYQIMTRNFVF